MHKNLQYVDISNLLRVCLNHLSANFQKWTQTDIVTSLVLIDLNVIQVETSAFANQIEKVMCRLHYCATRNFLRN